MKKLILVFILHFLIIPLCFAQSGIISTIIGNHSCGSSGDGGQATNAELSIPSQIAFDTLGNIIISDYGNNRIRKVINTGIITTVTSIGLISEANGITLDDSDNIYIADGGEEVILKYVTTTGIVKIIAGIKGYMNKGYSGDSGIDTNAQLDEPTGVTLDDSGNLFIADFHNNVIRKITMSTGIITTVVGNGYGHWAGAGTWTGSHTGDGGPATAATFYGTASVCFDKFGNMYIADSYNHAIRKVTKSTNIVTNIAGNGYGAGGPGGYSGDGGPATAAELFYPWDATPDDSGNVYIADNANNRIRIVSASTGVINTIAGNGTPGYSGNGGSATLAELDGPSGVILDRIGNLYIADEGNCVIREVTYNPTGINNVEKKSSIKVYPNPTKGVITFELNKLLNGFIDLFDIKGGLVLHKQISNSVESIDCSGLTDSVYLYKVTDEKGNIAGQGKIVIEK